MYIYNVTINIEESVHEQWLEWMKQEHVPAMLSTGKFYKALMTRVDVEEEMGGITYSIQYRTDSKETLQRYYDEDAEKLRAQSKPFAGKFIAFRTELEVIKEF
jgi:Domain of unknown function (DUF4286)